MSASSVTVSTPHIRPGLLSWPFVTVGLLVIAGVVWLRVQPGPSVALHWFYLVGLAFAITFFAVPVAHRVALWRGVVDVPSARKVHAIPTPLLGGVAVFTGFAVTVLLNFNFSRPLKGVALGATIVVAVGVVDDIVEIPAWLKLLGQLGAAAVALAYDVQLMLVPHWFPAAVALNAVITVVWLLTVTNAIQFLDGMDGLAAGVGVIAAFFFSIAAVQTNQRYLMYLSAAMVGACLAFLPYNFRPGGARIFLGDAGASFVGFALAGFAVMGEWSETSPLVALCTPLLILAVPLFDIGHVGVVRVLTGKVATLVEWLAYTGKDHIHHRFEALGLTKAQSVLLIYFIAATLGLSAIQLKGSRADEAMLILFQAVCVLAIIAILESVGRGRSAR
ncbi:MAG: undecaprenyl/decaprenyl-phosphate alpha-N-acetylglucosaminyl 1-phosphate transferase [Candidatus Rokubacteria bacterium]|nr:undecaprenyl/decaprenyl-phosphate alpha-N-acetylglucosaminyl 1-phosphate transferase [Candidatus Rokubacteria bacterium]